MEQQNMYVLGLVLLINKITQPLCCFSFFVNPGSLYTSAEYNYQNAFRNLCNINRSNCLSIRFWNPMFA